MSNGDDAKEQAIRDAEDEAYSGLGKGVFDEYRNEGGIRGWMSEQEDRYNKYWGRAAAGKNHARRASEEALKAKNAAKRKNEARQTLNDASSRYDDVASRHEGTAGSPFEYPESLPEMPADSRGDAKEEWDEWKQGAIDRVNDFKDAYADSDWAKENPEDYDKALQALKDQRHAGTKSKNADADIESGEAGFERATDAVVESLEGDLSPLETIDMASTDDLEEFEELQEMDEEEQKAAAISKAMEGTAARAMADESPESDDGSKQRFREQCYLMSHIKKYSAVSAQRLHNYQTDKEGASYDASRLMPYEESGLNQVIPIVGEPFGIINKLIGATNFQFFNSITPAQLSSLTPYFRLYKVVKDDKGVEKNIEIIFDTNVTTDDMKVFKSRHSRGYGSGFKNFDLIFDGNNFFTAKKSIKADLVMHFDSFNELLRTRASPTATTNKDSFRYIDLALRTPSKKDKNTHPQADSHGENYHIKAVLGWSPPDRETKKLFPRSVRKAIENSAVVVSLIPVNHKFDIDELGRVTFKLSYRAFADTVFSTPHADVLLTPNIAINVQKRMALLEQARDKGCEAKAINDLKKEMSKMQDADRSHAMSALLKKLVATKKIFHTSIPYEHIDLFVSDGPWAEELAPDYTSPTLFTPGTNEDMNNIFGTLNNMATGQSAGNPGSLEDLPANLFNMVKAPIAGEEWLINFFFLGDLINVGMDNISRCVQKLSTPSESVPSDSAKKYEDFGKSWERLRVCVGDIEFINPKDESRFRVNICDVPISVEYFVEWFMTRIISKGGEPKYLMANFIKDLMNNLLKQVAGSDECFGVSTKQRVHTQVAYLTGRPFVGTGGAGVEKLEYLMKTQQSSRAVDGKLKKRLFYEDHYNSNSPIIPALSKVEDAVSPNKEHFQYIIFYASRAYPYGRSGDYAEDASVGIYHYQIGSMFGIIKNIKFDKAEQPYLKEARFEQDGYQGLAQLREPYDVEISLFGNAAIFPGMYVYVDPRGLASELGSPQEAGDKVANVGGSFAFQLGLGGYYMVIKVSNSLSSGNFETIIKAKWVGTGAKVGDGSNGEAHSDPNEPCVDLLQTVANMSDQAGLGDDFGATAKQEAEAGMLDHLGQFFGGDGGEAESSGFDDDGTSE